MDREIVVSEKLYKKLTPGEREVLELSVDYGFSDTPQLIKDLKERYQDEKADRGH